MLKTDLQSMHIFKDLSDEALELLLPIVEPVDLPAGVTVFEQDSPTQYFYLLKNGEVTIRFKPDDGSLITVTNIQPGGIFGWSAALCRDCYTSAAITLTDCTIYRIIGRELQRFCQQHPDTGKLILERLSNEVSNRQYNTHDQVMNLLRQRIDASLRSLQQGQDHG
jgi:CRP-like cAMP-binding protein